MSIVVQKYGGSSVGDPEKLRHVAERIMATRAAGHKVVAVVSAMGSTTDELLGLAGRVSAAPERRELDMLLTAGERISMALLSMAIRELGGEAISFTGSQAGILTNDRHVDARIVEVRPYRVEDELERGRVVIVAGYQGVSYRREVTTLGRGGSDTTAVALAAALGAEWCEICSDVDGVYSADPSVEAGALRIEALGYDETIELATWGAKVLNPQAVEFARRKGIAIYARATAAPPMLAAVQPGDGSVIRKDAPPPPGAVRAVTSERSVPVVSGPSPHAMEVLAFLEERGIAWRDFREMGGEIGGFDLLLPRENLHDLDGLEGALETAFFDEVRVDHDQGSVTVAGPAINETGRCVLEGSAILREAGMEILRTTTSQNRVSWVIPATDVENAVHLLHGHFLG